MKRAATFHNEIDGSERVYPSGPIFALHILAEIADQPESSRHLVARAHRLGVSEETLAAGLAHLAEKGFIRAPGGDVMRLSRIEITPAGNAWIGAQLAPFLRLIARMRVKA